jgi:hypothetical protein
MTAVPRRRYQVGDYTATLLGEVETRDPVQYRFILAMVLAGQAQPSLYVTSEKSRRSEASQGSHRLRLIAEGFDEVLGYSDRWREEDAFVTEALSVAVKTLSLADEQALRLL